ncbi:MAG TPA: TetR/AcrR family transcriptional regulator C-terminal domain-containing protein [Anaerovoracaceae bacterium]|nr:TetR/AcrR family transcriptional regulator C-terminal domain-containing protein [Anaerovoracaceae bacterium]
MPHHTFNNSTKRMLADSLKKLMVMKPLNKISIHEIVEDCGVNRQTFYYHFHDIFDLLEWLFMQETMSLFEDRGNSLSLSDGMLRLLKYIQENKALCLCTLQSLGHNHLRKLFYDGINNVILSVVNEYSSDLNVPEKYKIFIAHFYTVSFAGFIENWLQEGLKDDPDEIIRLCEITMQGNIRGALERFQESE